MAGRPTFSYEKLKSWRDVALQVLERVQWQPVCAYDTTLYPDGKTTEQIRRDKIKASEELPNEKMRMAVLEPMLSNECFALEQLI